MILTMVVRSLWQRRGKGVVAALAVLMAACLVSAFFGLLWGSSEKWQKQARAYGANLFLYPKDIGMDFNPLGRASFLSERELAKLEKPPFSSLLYGFAPFLYVLTELRGEKVILTGIRPEKVRKTNPWWQVKGSWPASRASRPEAMVGVNIARSLGLRPGDAITLRRNSHTVSFKLTGIVTTGGAEDNQVIVTLAAAQDLAGWEDRVSLVQVSALGRVIPLSTISKRLEAAISSSKVMTSQQLVQAEKRVLGKLRLLMGLLAGIVLLCAGLGVAANMAGAILERTKEIGLMKALGASRRVVFLIFLSESGVTGLLAGILGYGAGLIIAQQISQQVFHSPLSFGPYPLIFTLIITVGISLLASFVPARRAAVINPAIVLRGE
ncbi:MAG: FtsX-like permease family protein [Thermodesulfobacteriota bacterium]